jgi:hypothetical protein
MNGSLTKLGLAKSIGNVLFSILFYDEDSSFIRQEGGKPNERLAHT